MAGNSDIFDEVAADARPTPNMWRDKTKALRVKQPHGAIQLWKLEGGEPKLVKEEKSSKGTNQ